ncbi:MAG: phosphopantetheine-binding protein [Pseudomonadota bacterium]
MRADNELLLAPGYFPALAGRHERIRAVQLRPKPGQADNELTRFRYDVVLEVGPQEQPRLGPQWLPWSGLHQGVDTLDALLASADGEPLALRDIPDARIERELSAQRRLHEAQAGEQVRHLRQALARQEARGVRQEALFALARKHGYALRLALGTGEPGVYHAVFSRGTGEEAAIDWSALQTEVPGVLANQPLGPQLQLQLRKRLAEQLQRQLPEYMVPAHLMVLDALPRTPNGKLDRRALPAAEARHAEAGYVAPQTPTEEALVAIWAELLKLERIGIHDNFFHLGGHSLLATQLISKLRSTLDVELPLRALFETSTVHDLAQRIDYAIWLRTGPAQDSDTTTREVEEI